MTEKDRVLAANLAFYKAFATRDLDAMAAVWASTLPVLCTHPGWMVLHGREAVLQSWRDILANEDSPTVACNAEEAVLYGHLAIVSCEEELPEAVLVATNVFAREAGEWRLVHHQAGPLAMRPSARRLS